MPRRREMRSAWPLRRAKWKRARCSLHTAWGFIVAVSILVLGLASVASFAVPWSKWLRLCVLEVEEIGWVMLLLSVYTVAGLLYSILGAVYRAGYKNARIGFLTNIGRLIEFATLAASVAMSQSMITLSRINGNAGGDGSCRLFRQSANFPDSQSWIERFLCERTQANLAAVCALYGYEPWERALFAGDDLISRNSPWSWCGSRFQYYKDTDSYHRAIRDLDQTLDFH